MPLYAYECQACGRRCEHVQGLHEPDPASLCCGPARRVMPRRVRGRVLEPGQVAAAKAEETRGELLARAGHVDIKREPGPLDIPDAPWSGPARSKAEAEDRYRDTTEAMASWQTRSLVASGVEYSQAKRQAEQHQQAVTAEAVASNRTR